jgi:Multidrug resistance efflux pump
MSMSKTTSRTSNLRAKIRIFIILTIVGGVAILGALLSLFLFEIEDTIYADGTIIPEHTFELVGHVDAHVKKFNFRTGDDVKEGDVIAELDARAYEADALAAESAVRELAAELEVKKAELRILEREPLPKELWYSHTNLKECQEKVERARDRLERSKKLQLVSAISKIEFERAELEAIQREAELARARENARRVDEGLGQQYIDKAKRDMELVAAKMEGKKRNLPI